MEWGGGSLGKAEGHLGWAAYYRAMGDREGAFHHATEALARANQPRQPLALIAAHRLLGELDTEAPRNDDAVRHLDESLALADACQAPYERALTLLAMAELRAATGDHNAAQALINEVKAICEPLGTKPALARADVLAMPSVASPPFAHGQRQTSDGRSSAREGRTAAISSRRQAPVDQRVGVFSHRVEP